MQSVDQIAGPLLRKPGKLPEGIPLPRMGIPLLACGAETGTSFTVTDGRHAYVSQNISDLRNPGVYDVYQDSIRKMMETLCVEPRIATHDLHPDYVSTRYAHRLNLDTYVAVQHHHAHAAACMHENGLNEKVIAIVYDGMGLGDDGTVWGGEFLVCDLCDYERKAHLKQYSLPGGDQATFYPERMAYSCLVSEFGYRCKEVVVMLKGLSEEEKTMLSRIMSRHLNSPLTSSAGRLFDAVAAMLGFEGKISSPAEAAIALQSMAKEGVNEAYTFDICGQELSFRSMFSEICVEMCNGADKATVAAKFHNTLAEGTVEMCGKLCSQEGINKVVLSGGVFYNRLLSDQIIQGLRNKGFSVYIHRLLAPGDVSVSFGQAVIACARGYKEMSCA